MGVDGIHSDRPAFSDHRPPVEEDTRDPRYGLLPGRTLSSAPASSQGVGAKPLLGDDSLQLTPDDPTNPFESLVKHRRRRRKRQDGDASLLDG